MSETPRDGLWVNSNLFTENHNKFPAEEYLRYAGKYIAWNLDATTILSSDDDEFQLVERLKQSGIDPSKVIVEYVLPLDVIGII